MFNFPASPANGQTYSPQAGLSYTYDGTGWKLTSGGYTGVFISDTPPTSPTQGQLWWESDSGVMFIYYNDGTSSQWIQATDAFTGLAYPDRIQSMAYDVMAGFRTSSSFVLNSKADGSGTDVFTVTNAGAMSAVTVTAGNCTMGGSTIVGPVLRTHATAGGGDSTANVVISAGSVQITAGGTYGLTVGNLNWANYVSLGPNIINSTGGALTFQIAGTNGPLVNTNRSIYIPAPASSYALDARSRTDSSAIIGFLGNTSYYGIVGYSTNPGYSFYGNVGAYLAGGSWATSDKQFKVVSGTLDGNDALDTVLAIPVVAYTPKSPAARLALGLTENDPEERFGFLAQDIEPLIPIAIHEVTPPAHDLTLRALLAGVDVPEEDTEEAIALGEQPLTFKAMNDKYLLATLWSAVQTLTARVQELEANQGV
jgi:hypothetical protein